MSTSKKTTDKPKTCAWKHCTHPSPVISDGEGVGVGKTWFHKDCNETRLLLKEIGETYFEQVSKNVVYAQLVRTINNIVFSKGVDPKLLLFALRYAIKHKIPLKSPYGLHYLVSQERIQTSYNTYLKQQQKLFETKAEEAKAETFAFEKAKPRGFDSVFGIEATK